MQATLQLNPYEFVNCLALKAHIDDDDDDDAIVLGVPLFFLALFRVRIEMKIPFPNNAIIKPFEYVTLLSNV